MVRGQICERFGPADRVCNLGTTRPVQHPGIWPTAKNATMLRWQAPNTSFLGHAIIQLLRFSCRGSSAYGKWDAFIKLCSFPGPGDEDGADKGPPMTASSGSSLHGLADFKSHADGNPVLCGRCFKMCVQRRQPRPIQRQGVDAVKFEQGAMRVCLLPGMALPPSSAASPSVGSVGRARCRRLRRAEASRGELPLLRGRLGSWHGAKAVALSLSEC